MSNASQQKVVNYRKTVAFLKMFLDGGFTLDDTLESFKATVMMYGDCGEAEVVEFLAHRGIASWGAGSVLNICVLTVKDL